MVSVRFDHEGARPPQVEHVARGLLQLEGETGHANAGAMKVTSSFAAPARYLLRPFLTSTVLRAGGA